MKKLLALLLLVSGVALATTTTRLGLDKIDDGTTPWGEAVRDNYDLIDAGVAVLNSTQTFSGGVTLSSATANTMRFNQVIIATAPYSGTAQLAANGTMVVGGGVSGGTIQSCDGNFRNCSILANNYFTLSSIGSTGVSVRHDQSATGGLQLQAGTVQGSCAINGSNVPGVFSADHLMIGPVFGDRIANSVSTTGTRSAIENSLYIGTHTVTGAPQFAVRGSTSNAYSLLIGTSPMLSGSDFQLALSTGGVLSTRQLSISSTVLTGPSLTAGTSGQVLVSRGNGLSPFWVAPTYVQIVSTTNAVGFGSTSTTFVATNLRGQITNVQAGNKVKVCAYGDIVNNTASDCAQITIVRDGTNLAGGTNGLTRICNNASTAGIDVPVAACYDDLSPATGTNNYAVHIKAITGGTASFNSVDIDVMTMEEHR